MVSQTLWYIYAGDQVVAEIDSATASVQRKYRYYPGAVDAPHSLVTGGRTYYYLTDPVIGSVGALIDSTGAIANRYRYAPFGTLEDSLESVTNPIRFAGREYDSDAQLYYNRTRYYDPQLGRFISEDPLGIGAGLNQYAYANDDPINLNDPDGRCPRNPAQGMICLDFYIPGALACTGWSASSCYLGDDRGRDPYADFDRSRVQLLIWPQQRRSAMHVSASHSLDGRASPPSSDNDYRITWNLMGNTDAFEVDYQFYNSLAQKDLGVAKGFVVPISGTLYIGTDDGGRSYTVSGRISGFPELDIYYADAHGNWDLIGVAYTNPAAIGGVLAWIKLTWGIDVVSLIHQQTQ